MTNVFKIFSLSAAVLLGASVAHAQEAKPAQPAQYGHYDCEITTIGTNADQTLEQLLIRNKVGGHFEACLYSFFGPYPQASITIGGHEEDRTSFSSDLVSYESTSYKIQSKTKNSVNMSFYGSAQPGGFSVTVGSGFGTSVTLGTFTCAYSPEKTKEVCFPEGKN